MLRSLQGVVGRLRWVCKRWAPVEQGFGACWRQRDGPAVGGARDEAWQTAGVTGAARKPPS